MKRQQELSAHKTFHTGLGPSQMIAYAKIIRGTSVFLTGSAGTGKSELLKRLIGHWTSQRHNFTVTATTGLAAVALKGCTFHSYFWIRPQDDDPSVTFENILQRLMSNHQAYTFYKRRIMALQTLIVDEISLMSAELFTKVSNVLKIIRSSNKPFGGIQLVLVGDFFQLPPVKAKFLFECPLFRECVTESLILTECYRQKDQSFVELLGRMRLGECTPEDIAVLQSRVGVNIEQHGILPTELFPTNKDVDQLNADKLEQINTQPIIFTRVSGLKTKLKSNNDNDKLTKFLKDLNVPEQCTLKAPNYALYDTEVEAERNGAQVMLTFNLKQERGLVNGSRGVVIDFEEPSKTVYSHSSIYTDFDDEKNDYKAYIKGLKHPKVRFMINGEPVEILVPMVRYERHEKGLLLYAWCMPLKLAWATTVHKSQGQSLDLVKATIDHTVFADGQAYVAISRARTLEGLSLKAFQPEAIRASQKVREFYSSIARL